MEEDRSTGVAGNVEFLAGVEPFGFTVIELHIFVAVLTSTRRRIAESHHSTGADVMSNLYPVEAHRYGRVGYMPARHWRILMV